jgi:hypothetical protein
MREPAFGLPATWIDDSLREEATFRGYTVVDPATVLTTHLTEILKESMPDLLSYAEVQKLLKELPPEQKKLADDLIPAVVSATTVQRVLQSLLRERVSIRDLPAILEGVGEAAPHTTSVTNLVEQVRARLSRQLSFAYRGDDGTLPIITLSPEWDVARMGDGVLGGPGRPGRGEAAGAGALAAAGLHPPGARLLRAGRARRGIPRAADQPGDPPLRPLDHRAVPRPDLGHEPERDPSARPAQDRRADLARVEGATSAPLRRAPRAASGFGEGRPRLRLA